jgi:hypothetical protein
LHSLSSVLSVVYGGIPVGDETLKHFDERRFSS